MLERRTGTSTSRRKIARRAAPPPPVGRSPARTCVILDAGRHSAAQFRSPQTRRGSAPASFACPDRPHFLCLDRSDGPVGVAGFAQPRSQPWTRPTSSGSSTSSTASAASTRRSSSSAIEQGLLTAARKRFGEDAVLEVRLDRKTGTVDCSRDGKPEDLEFGRIAAQTARQVMNQRIREAERDKNLDEYNRRLQTIVTGSIQRIEGGNLIVNLGRVEGIVPRSEQIRGENYKVGDRIRAYLFEVRPQGQRVRIVLSRAHVDFVRKLFELEVPEVGEGMINIKNIVREAGYKTKLAVESLGPEGRPDRRLRRRARQPHPQHHRRAERREDRHPEVGGAARGHGRGVAQARADQLDHAELRHEDGRRARRRGPALARHRPPGRQRAPRVPALGLGHPDQRREADRGSRRGRRRARKRRSRAKPRAPTPARVPPTRASRPTRRARPTPLRPGVPRRTPDGTIQGSGVAPDRNRRPPRHPIRIPFLSEDPPTRPQEPTTPWRSASTRSRSSLAWAPAHSSSSSPPSASPSGIRWLSCARSSKSASARSTSRSTRPLRRPRRRARESRRRSRSSRTNRRRSSRGPPTIAEPSRRTRRSPTSTARRSRRRPGSPRRRTSPRHPPSPTPPRRPPPSPTPSPTRPPIPSRTPLSRTAPSEERTPRRRTPHRTRRRRPRRMLRTRRPPARVTPRRRGPRSEPTPSRRRPRSPRSRPHPPPPSAIRAWRRVRRPRRARPAT